MVRRKGFFERRLGEYGRSKGRKAAKLLDPREKNPALDIQNDATKELVAKYTNKSMKKNYEKPVKKFSEKIGSKIGKKIDKNINKNSKSLSKINLTPQRIQKFENKIDKYLDFKQKADQKPELPSMEAFSKLLHEAKNKIDAFSGLEQNVRNNFNETVQTYSKGEGILFPGTHYMGPGNSLLNGRPASDVDNRARIHDIQYSELQKKGVDPYFTFNRADAQFLKDLKVKNASTLAGYLGISVKKIFPKEYTPVSQVSPYDYSNPFKSDYQAKSEEERLNIANYTNSMLQNERNNPTSNPKTNLFSKNLSNYDLALGF